MSELGNMSYNVTPPTGGNGTESDQDEALSWSTNLLLLFLDLMICLFGLVGNGIVIWVLTFQIKRNSCMVYILNLAVADFTFVVGSTVNLIHLICTQFSVEIPAESSRNLVLITRLMYNFGFNTSCFVLTAISVERCLHVLFPVRIQRYRPAHLSGIICLLLWLLSCLVTPMQYFYCRNIANFQNIWNDRCTSMHIFTSTLYLLLTLLLITSSLILLIHIQKASKQCHPLRLYIVIIGTCLIFFLSVVPSQLLYHLSYFNFIESNVLVYFFYATVTLNSIHCSSNPYVYLTVGWWRKRGSRGCITQALSKVFKEENKTLSS